MVQLMSDSFKMILNKLLEKENTKMDSVIMEVLKKILEAVGGVYKTKAQGISMKVIGETTGKMDTVDKKV
jgi:hypothetical protein